ncbi:uncharacterized protein [Macaca fascicularis]|uniref:uncharacterized protein n=1 Tax=Macaca fascicularis TaxID=9541 RepID=UPI0032B07737
MRAGGWNGSRGPPLSPPGPRLVAGPPRARPSVPGLLAQSPPWCVSPQLRRLSHCSWLLAELWKPPRLNAEPADVTAACDQSAPRGPSVNHSASPGPGECGETAFRGSVAAAPAAPRCADGGQHRARAPSCSALHPPERLNLFTVPLALDENVGSSDSSQPWATASLFEPPAGLKHHEAEILLYLSNLRCRRQKFFQTCALQVLFNYHAANEWLSIWGLALKRRLLSLLNPDAHQCRFPTHLETWWVLPKHLSVPPPAWLPPCQQFPLKPFSSALGT